MPYFTQQPLKIYAPTNDATDETKDSFIEQLDIVIAGTSKHDTLLVMEDFNARLGWTLKS